MPTPPLSVAELGLRLRSLGWVSDLFVGGSAATGRVYVQDTLLDRLDARHPMWTHVTLVHRVLSRMARVELAFTATPCSVDPLNLKISCRRPTTMTSGTQPTPS